MNNCRRYEKRKIINTILEDHFEEFKTSQLERLKNKEIREHITEVVEKSLTCGKIEYGYVKYRCLICVTMTAIDFIGKLVNHIHSKGFRVVRRYGLYSRKKHKLSMEIIKLYNFIKQREIINTVKNKNKSFKDRLIETFGVNPFICSKCGEEMILWEISIPKYGKIYDVLDESNYRTVVNEEIYGKENKKEKISIYNYEQMCLF